MTDDDRRSGFVAIIGAPNVGKSTFLNRVLGAKIAATSRRPQTTRTRILGVLNLERAQVVFLDTPGIHRPRSVLHQSMVKSALGVLSEVDLIMLMEDCLKQQAEEEEIILGHLRNLKTPAVAVLNKIDRIKPPLLLPQIDRLSKLNRFEAIVPISALTGEGISELNRELVRHLPLGEPLFPEDTLTDQPEKVIAAELIREKVFRLVGQEVPYGVAVGVTDFQERKRGELIYLRAVIYVERESHKGILIGAKGAKLKEIGQKARVDIEGLLGVQVYLDLQVKVEKDWTRKSHLIRKLGYEP